MVHRIKEGSSSATSTKVRQESFAHYFKKNYQLYVMAIPSMVCLIMFLFIPIFWNIIAFENFSVAKGIFGSKWIGLDNFVKFFNSPYFGRLIGNTFMLGIVSIVFTFPVPIIFALLLNEVKHNRFKKVSQTISYIPYFISVVVVIGLFKEMLSINNGVVNNMIAAFGLEKIYFFGEPGWFRALYVITSLWSGMGYSSIIYLSAISGVNPELYESAVIDGANRWNRAIHITLPSISPTIVILFIMTIGS
ncbi:MAG: ABC transporter permease subunit, partial [Oscillospiraceae bacterium]